MKYMLLLFFIFSCEFVAQGQTKSPLENVVITSKKNKTQVRTNENGEPATPSLFEIQAISLIKDSFYTTFSNC